MELNFLDVFYVYIVGNCLCLPTDCQYDRVYCGAMCPKEYELYMKNLIRVGGILVMPFNDLLLKIERISETTWIEYHLVPAMYATLILPTEEEARKTVDIGK